MRVAIADDDPIVCSSLSTILEATGTADVAWTANTGTDAVTQYEMDAPDVLLVDVQMPGMDGLQASEAILDAHPNARILILTTFADGSYIAKALEIGTKGLLDQTGRFVRHTRGASRHGRTSGHGRRSVEQAAGQSAIHDIRRILISRSRCVA